jgi:aminoglycoside phosphotransferase (APT) family kinase protein
VESPIGDIDADEALVRALLTDQHPDLDDLPLEVLAIGWDNALWCLGDELLVRLPRRWASAPLIENEQRWLAELAPLLSLPVPVPVRVGRPSGLFPWSWSVVPWLQGSPGDQATITDPVDASAKLGRFLRDLHKPAPRSVRRSAVRGGPLRDRASSVEERIEELSEEIDVEAIRRVWQWANGVPSWNKEPTWLHGDLHPANLLVTGGTLAAVIDFGDICAGDPATDLAAFWMLLPESVMAIFADEYGSIDRDLEARGLGWATFFGLMLLSIGLVDKPTYANVGRATLARATARYRELI